jgi:transcriptional regulator with XRE-family HTH domain
MIQKYEDGEVMPSFEQLHNIASVLDIPFLALISADDPDSDYTVIRTDLNNAGFTIVEGIIVGYYYISPNDDPEKRFEVRADKLIEIMKSIMDDAERLKVDYVHKRIEADLFRWRP